MTPEEKAAYQRGYVAGRKRKAKDRERERFEAQRAAFRQRAFLAALPACIAAQGWKRGEQPINSMEARTALAWDFADEALKRFW
jgi:hypothetical protein